MGSRMVVIDQLVEEDKLLPEDQVTMQEVRKMANSVCPMIQLTEDYCSNPSNKLLPILDLQVKVQKVEEVAKLFYYHYRKPMANW